MKNKGKSMLNEIKTEELVKKFFTKNINIKNSFVYTSNFIVENMLNAIRYEDRNIFKNI